MCCYCFKILWFAKKSPNTWAGQIFQSVAQFYFFRRSHFFHFTHLVKALSGQPLSPGFSLLCLSHFSEHLDGVGFLWKHVSVHKKACHDLYICHPQPSASSGIAKTSCSLSSSQPSFFEFLPETCMARCLEAWGSGLSQALWPPKEKEGY